MENKKQIQQPKQERKLERTNCQVEHFQDGGFVVDCKKNEAKVTQNGD